MSHKIWWYRFGCKAEKTCPIFTFISKADSPPPTDDTPNPASHNWAVFSSSPGNLGKAIRCPRQHLWWPQGQSATGSVNHLSPLHDILLSATLPDPCRNLQNFLEAGTQPTKWCKEDAEVWDVLPCNSNFRVLFNTFRSFSPSESRLFSQWGRGVWRIKRVSCYQKPRYFNL